MQRLHLNQFSILLFYGDDHLLSFTSSWSRRKVKRDK